MWFTLENYETNTRYSDSYIDVSLDFIIKSF